MRGPRCWIHAGPYQPGSNQSRCDYLRRYLRPFGGVTAKERRDTENARALGGLRNPHVSALRVPGWDSVGRRVRRALGDTVGVHCRSVLDTLGSVGSDEAMGFPVAVVRAAQQALLSEFGGDLPETADWDTTVIGRTRLFGLLLGAANDPDVSLPRWLDGFTPLGITQPIATHGIFPLSGASDAAGSIAELTQGQDYESRNYSSYYDHADLASAELERDRDRGYLVWSPSLRELERDVGTLVPSRIAALVKLKAGRTKVRRIHDLRRSRVNSLATVPERIVLPRLSDAVQSTGAAAADRVV